MKVSIIIPVYNADKYLEECIESALNQTYRDIEIIAVDDGSTDKSLEILKKYADKITVIAKKNEGAASALNTGIMIAKGEWLKWLNADDVLYPNAVEQLLTEAENQSDKTNTIFYANYDFIDSHGKIIGRKNEPNYNNLDSFNFNVILLDHHIGNQNTVLFSRSIMNRYGIFNEKLGQEDYELHLRYCIINHCRLHLVEKTVAKYRIHKNQISRANAKNPILSDKIRNHILDKLDSNERKKYQIALSQYKKNIPKIQKIRQFLGKVIFNNFPTSISNRIAIMYLLFTHRKNHISKDDTVNNTKI